MDARGFTSQLLFVLSGLIIWTVHFLVVYPFNALACARNFTTAEIFGVGIVPFTIVCVTIGALALIVVVLFVALRERAPKRLQNVEASSFLRTITVGLGMLSAVAIVLETIPVFMIPPCG